MAQIILNIPDAQVPQIVTAYGAGTPAATLPLIKVDLANFIISKVKQYNQQQAINAATASLSDPIINIT